MRPQQLNRLLNLIKKTGDRLVVLDQATDFATVLLPLDSYERLIDKNDGDDWHALPESIPPEGSDDDMPPLPVHVEEQEDAEIANLPEEVPPAVPENKISSSTPEAALPTAEPIQMPEHIVKAEAADEVEHHGQVPVYEPGKKTLDFSENWATENAKPISEEDLSDVAEDEEKFYPEPVE